jgi:hypothetical protein
MKRLAIPKVYSKKLVIKWIPIPEIMAICGLNFINSKVRAQADSQVPNPASPLMGKIEVSSAPVSPKIVFQKFNALKINPWLRSKEKRRQKTAIYFASRTSRERRNTGKYIFRF